ncbi:MAG: SDR family oxidoreductase [Myxococcales bacterium]|nr:SDR family oxidoreductase [Myxococcales bacterium]
MARWLLTGATGTLGREILWDLIAGGDEVLCLVRGADPREAEARIDDLIARRPQGALPAEERARIRVVQGDLTADRFGMDPKGYEALAEAVTGIIHGAANVNFTQALPDARRVNVEGTRQVLAFAHEAKARGGLTRFEHISTAYVCGNRRGPILEGDLTWDQGFNNTYEQTKNEAERMIAEHRGDLPIVVVRPSIVVGDSKTGYTSSFKVMYFPLKILAAGYVWVIPADPEGRVDLVPVDYVVATMRALRANPDSVGRTVHVTAGGAASKIGELVRMGVDFFGVRMPIMISPKIFDYSLRPLLYITAGPKRTKKLRAARVFIPYLAHRAAFDTSERDLLVDPTTLAVPSVQSYFERLLRYCIDSEWGSKDPVTGAPLR